MCTTVPIDIGSVNYSNTWQIFMQMVYMQGTSTAKNNANFSRGDHTQI